MHNSAEGNNLKKYISCALKLLYILNLSHPVYCDGWFRKYLEKLIAFELLQINIFTTMMSHLLELSAVKKKSLLFQN